MRLLLSGACFWLLALGQVVTAAEPSQDIAKRDAPAAEPPDAKDVLQQVVRDLLTNRELQFAREFYGRPGDKRIALQFDSPVAWPTDWRPKVPGYEIRRECAETPVLDFICWHAPWGVEICSFIQNRTPRLLGVRLDVCHLDPRRKYDDQIDVCLFNIGGNGGDAPVIGGCHVLYNLKRKQGKWLVEYGGCEAQ